MKKRITKSTVDRLKAGPRTAFLWDTDVTGFGVKVTPKGRKVYVLQYRARGQSSKAAPKRITLGKHGHLTADDARKLAAKAMLSVKSGGNPSASILPQESPTVAQLADRFLAEYLPAKKHPPRQSTVTYYESLFRCHVLPRLGKRLVAEVTNLDVEKLHVGLRETPYIANRTVTVLQHAFDQAEAWGWRAQHTNPAKHVERYREERRGGRKEVMLTPDQMRKLLEAIDDEEAAGGDATSCRAIRVAFWTGWRIGEVLRLEWDNVDLERGVAKLLQTKTADEEYRQVPSEALSVIERQPKVAGCPYVFPGRWLKGYLTTVKGPWLRIRKRARLTNLEGLGAFRLHDLRHNVVSWDVSRGVPLEIAGRNVGHRSREATEVYAHFAPDALKRAADARAEAMRAAVEGAVPSNRLRGKRT